MLKYYKEERAKYGEMGDITIEECQRTADWLSRKLQIPRVQVFLKVRKARKVDTSKYRGGLGMFGVSGGIAKPLHIPAIHMNSRMLTWLTFVHEYAHHVHMVRFNQKLGEILTLAGLNPSNTTKENRVKNYRWVSANIAPQRSHGPEFANHVQRLVEICLDEGFIKETPNYLQKLKFAKTDSYSLTYTESANTFASYAM